jgi:mannose-6-phosphate isomerase-like protein (cupin superfamily)
VPARITRSVEAPAYDPPLHNGVVAKRLQGHEAGATERFWVGESLYLPGGEAETSPTAAETVYVVLEGELTLTVPGDEAVAEVLSVGDSVHMPTGTTRSVRNDSGVDARLLVIIATPTQTGT